MKNKIKEIESKFKAFIDKDNRLKILFIIGIIGILLIFLSSFFEDEKTKETSVSQSSIDTNTDEFIECETLVSALGLVPDTSLANDLKTTDANGKASYPEWLHFCGNADFVHEIADSASSQGEKLGLTLAHKLHQ